MVCMCFQQQWLRHPSPHIILFFWENKKKASKCFHPTMKRTKPFNSWRNKTLQPFVAILAVASNCPDCSKSFANGESSGVNKLLTSLEAGIIYNTDGRTLTVWNINAQRVSKKTVENISCTLAMSRCIYIIFGTSKVQCIQARSFKMVDWVNSENRCSLGSQRSELNPLHAF